MTFVTLPNPLTDGTTAKGSEVRANDDAIVGVVNGQIDDSNVKTGAALNGNKLSTVAGARVPSTCIEDNAVGSTQLSQHPSVAAQQAVGTNHIKDSAVIVSKLAAQAVVYSKVKTAQADASGLPASLSPGTFTSWTSGSLTPANALPLMAYTVLSGGSGASANLLIVYLSVTSAGFWQVVVFNPTGSVVTLTNTTFRFLYVPVA